MLNRKSAIKFMCLVIPGLLLFLAPANAYADSGPRPFFAVSSGNANPVPTSDPCILTNTEAGPGYAMGLGLMTWESEEVVDFCADEDPNTAAVEGQLVLTAANGDEIFGVYHTLATVNPDLALITFAGTYDFTGGSGRFENVTGTGTLAGQGSLLPPFEASAALAGTLTPARPRPRP